MDYDKKELCELKECIKVILDVLWSNIQRFLIEGEEWIEPTIDVLETYTKVYKKVIKRLKNIQTAIKDYFESSDEYNRKKDLGATLCPLIFLFPNTHVRSLQGTVILI